MGEKVRPNSSRTLDPESFSQLSSTINIDRMISCKRGIRDDHVELAKFAWVELQEISEAKFDRFSELISKSVQGDTVNIARERLMKAVKRVNLSGSN
jgi:succinate dehydrogenase flavin-adding protein (antitoxin of CptAB toxin-antitoxin module)